MKIIIALLLSIILGNASAQSTYQNEIEAWQEEINQSFSDPETSPFKGKALRKFKSLPFYSINEMYQVTALLKRTPNALPFMMATTTDRKLIYQKYGEAHFNIDSTQIMLSLYQSLSSKQTGDDNGYLFLPFTDLTSGVETYGGGRYLDLRIPDGDSLIIDFNKAYNPACAYNAQYSCPIPPRENDIKIKIEAGVMVEEKDL